MRTDETNSKMDPVMQDFFGTTDPQEYERLMVLFQRKFVETTRKLSETPQGRRRLRKAGLLIVTQEKADELLAVLADKA